ncbi:MAG: 4-alpha-glucanotransferase [Clostridiales bacterium]|jgi:4-alpha-glucanotransferase|nr:4-alpha-glucanotransferase [Clostridiales bacterium]
MKRSSGVIAHPTSFPSPYGIGDLGKGAIDFIDFVKNAGLKLWQILPLGPTSFGDSPYQSFSTFAGNHYLISPDILREQGYLTDEDLYDKPYFPNDKVDYGPVITYKMNIFHKAHDRFSATLTKQSDYLAFCVKNAEWLNDYALFMAAKEYFINKRQNDFDDTRELVAFRKSNEKFLTENQIRDYYYGAVCSSWPEDLAKHDPVAVKNWTDKLLKDVEFFKFLQYEFFREWALVKEYANDAGIKIIGDIPIFVAMDSSDTWANKNLFQLDERGYPLAVAGVPPDYFSETGQLWGNPLYFWPAHKSDNYKWWNLRIHSALRLVDILRIDHFRGFESYWSVPYGEKTAVNGKWMKGPGLDVFNNLGKLPIIAEDLGVITDEVLALREATGFPGMAVLQFAFGSDSKNTYLPHNYKNPNVVCYTGTHDNNTTVGWYIETTDKERDYFRRYLNVTGDNVAWDMIRLAYSSSAAYAIVPLQDLMCLGEEGRMNTPGVAVGNWQFRFKKDALTSSIIDGIRYLTEVYNR